MWVLVTKTNTLNMTRQKNAIWFYDFGVYGNILIWLVV